MIIKRFFYTLKQAFLQVIEKPHDVAGIDICHNCDAADFKHIFYPGNKYQYCRQSIQQDYDSIEIFLLDETTEEQANVIIDDIKQEKGVDDAYFKNKRRSYGRLQSEMGRKCISAEQPYRKPSSQLRGGHDRRSGIR